MFFHFGDDLGGLFVRWWSRRTPDSPTDMSENRIMPGLREVEKLLPALSRGEKAQLLKWVVRDLGDDFPGVDSQPDVCGGEPCVVRTRIPVWLLEQARRLGTTENRLLEAYPSLRAGDLANAWAFVRAYPAEIEAQIRDNESA